MYIIEHYISSGRAVFHIRVRVVDRYSYTSLRSQARLKARTERPRIELSIVLYCSEENDMHQLDTDHLVE